MKMLTSASGSKQTVVIETHNDALMLTWELTLANRRHGEIASNNQIGFDSRSSRVERSFDLSNVQYYNCVTWYYVLPLYYQY